MKCNILYRIIEYDLVEKTNSLNQLRHVNVIVLSISQKNCIFPVYFVICSQISLSHSNMEELTYHSKGSKQPMQQLRVYVYGEEEEEEEQV